MFAAFTQEEIIQKVLHQDPAVLINQKCFMAIAYCSIPNVCEIAHLSYRVEFSQPSVEKLSRVLPVVVGRLVGRLPAVGAGGRPGTRRVGSFPRVNSAGVVVKCPRMVHVAEGMAVVVVVEAWDGQADFGADLGPGFLGWRRRRPRRRRPLGRGWRRRRRVGLASSQLVSPEKPDTSH